MTLGRRCIWLLSTVLLSSGCIPFAIPEERTGAIVENRDQLTYLLDFEEAGIPVEPGPRLAWELPPGAPAWAMDTPGRGSGDLVLMTPACEVLDRVALDGSTLVVVVEGARFSSVTELGELDHTPPLLQEIEAPCP
jgi:hypothetical protein